MKTKWMAGILVVSVMAAVGLEYNEIDTSNGPVSNTGYSRASFEATLRHLRRTTTAQTLTASGAADTTKLVTLINVTSGSATVTLGNGTVANQQKEFYFIGSGGEVTLSGTFHDFSSLEFDTNSRSAVLFWVNSKWMAVGGNYRGN